MMLEKLSLFGPRERIPDEDTIRCIAKGISDIGFGEIATGGVCGFPSELVRRLDDGIFSVAYSPFVDLEEWRSYEEVGIAADHNIFSRIVWSEICGSLEKRAKGRITPFIRGSYASLAYFDSGNTSEEIRLSISLDIPNFCLVERDGLEECCDALGKSVIFSNDPEEIVYCLRRCSCGE